MIETKLLKTPNEHKYNNNKSIALKNMKETTQV